MPPSSPTGYTGTGIKKVGGEWVEIVCLDLEGVLVPEIWISVAECAGVPALAATTRNIPDYDALMRQRLGILDQQGLRLTDIQAVIAGLAPLDGATDFVENLRQRFQLIVLSDTFYEFAMPLMRQLGWPVLFCNRLKVDENGRISGYRLRLPDHKRQTVTTLQDLRFTVFAAGDSYNDTGMLTAADSGFLFRPPDNVIAAFPQFPVVTDYGALLRYFLDARKVKL